LTKTEAVMIEICKKKFRIERIDPQDDLRRLGADSMFIVELAVELEAAFDIYVPPEALEADTHIYRIAEWVDITCANEAGSAPGNRAAPPKAAGS
jgi:acyl carrier protein